MSTHPSAFPPGHRISGRYRLDELIATGSAGEVWRATDEVLDRAVAVKLLRPALVDDPGFVERFRVEARLAGRLSHPGVVAVYDFGEDHGPLGSPWLIMEYVDGESLAAILAREAPLDPGRALDLVIQAAEAVAAAHRDGVIHRDIKPANLLVAPDDRVKVTDFGIARAIGGVSLTATGQVLGTAHYLSPEQARGEAATTASDVYALGVVLYECLSGQRPFHGPTPVAVARAHINTEPPPLAASVPPALRRLVERLLDKDPAHRPPDAAALVGELRPLLSNPVEADGVADAVLPRAIPTEHTTVISTDDFAAVAGTSRAERRRNQHSRRRHRTPSKLTMATVAAVLALGVFAGIAALGADDEQPGDLGSSPEYASTPSVVPTSDAPATVAVDAAQYVGRPYDEVASTLRSLGFSVKRSDVAGEAEPGTVSALAPTGELPYGATITVSVVTQAPPRQQQDEGGADLPGVGDDKKDRGGNGKGKGRG